MIFVTVGTQLPFDRLLAAIDDWAFANPGEQIIAQTGVTTVSSPRIDARPFVDGSTFRELVQQADVLVAHAGMGSILTAVEFAKPVIVMPRRADLGEHRNDHQLATVQNLAHLSNLEIVQDAQTLSSVLDKQLGAGPLEKLREGISDGHRRLVGEISNFIAGGSLGGTLTFGEA
ncbi:glycosyltransferase [Phaeobacter marinintestinus]|uniref:glycosyltransferase n=1 Tax=Falsiphaeobacter marinintestinus TaxID=1492905 RepID=UPI0011B80F78|nr:glycosyltransferase [Phaeobacter marinintestinus]